MKDRRLKLTTEQRNEIKKLSNQGIAYRELARRFGVSDTTIRNVCRPEVYQALLKKRKEEKHHLKYYNTEYNTKMKRKYKEENAKKIRQNSNQQS